MDPQNPQHGQHGQQSRPAYDLSLGGHYGASAAVHLLPCPPTIPRHEHQR